jgi:hypothetical protein
MSASAYVYVSGTVFMIVCVLQAIRASKKLPVQIGTRSIPVGASWIAALVSGALAIWALLGR